MGTLGKKTRDETRPLLAKLSKLKTSDYSSAPIEYDTTTETHECGELDGVWWIHGTGSLMTFARRDPTDDEHSDA